MHKNKFTLTFTYNLSHAYTHIHTLHTHSLTLYKVHTNFHTVKYANARSRNAYKYIHSHTQIYKLFCLEP